MPTQKCHGKLGQKNNYYYYMHVSTHDDEIKELHDEYWRWRW